MLKNISGKRMIAKLVLTAETNKLLKRSHIISLCLVETERRESREETQQKRKLNPSHGRCTCDGVGRNGVWKGSSVQPAQTDPVPGSWEETWDGQTLSITGNGVVLPVRSRFCIDNRDQKGLEDSTVSRPGQEEAVPWHVADSDVGHNWLLLLWVMTSTSTYSYRSRTGT